MSEGERRGRVEEGGRRGEEGGREERRGEREGGEREGGEEEGTKESVRGGGRDKYYHLVPLQEQMMFEHSSRPSPGRQHIRL